MNRNTNAHFSELPKADISRSVLDRSHSHKTAANVGDLIPVFVDPDILPGDTVSIDTSKVVRFQTMLSPMMDNMQCDFYWFFVPHRLVWDHWINFMGENTESAWTPDVEYTVPTITIPPKGSGNNNYVGSILDYMGIPVENNTSAIEVNALPIRAYSKIVNDWFVSEAVTDPLNLYTGDSTVTATKEQSYINDVPHGGKPFVAAKYHDYFTSVLPSPQKGDPVEMTVYMTGFSPVITRNVDTGAAFAPIVGRFGNGDTDFIFPFSTRTSQSGDAPNVLFKYDSGNFSTTYGDAANAAATYDTFSPVNLWTQNTGSGTFSVNDVRYAFQLQKLLEKDARGGTRYIEVIRSHFGVQSPDSRLQRSEYLGGNRFGIVVDQVLNNAQSEQDFLGDLGAFSLSHDVHSDFTHSFTEHGTLMCLMVVRYDHTYAQGLNKFWSRSTRFDYYWPVFANIGEQPVLKKEIYCDGELTDLDVFGYQEAWADYRYMPNRVSSEMRPYVTNGLGSWSLTDDYNAKPSFSDPWLREDKTNVDRVLAVTSSNAMQYWADIYFNAKYTRPMPVYSIPGLIDHH